MTDEIVKPISIFKLAFIALFILLGACVTTNVPKTPDSLKIYNRFVSANYIASICEFSDNRINSKHASNFAIVSSRARTTYMNMYPTASKEQLEKKFSKTHQTLKKAASDFIDVASCSSKEIQEELGIYKKQADWNLEDNYFNYIQALSSTTQKPTNLQPMYGESPKSTAQQDADSKFISNILSKGYTRQSGAIALVASGLKKFRSEDLITAMKRFNQAWLLDPDNSDVYLGFAILQAEQNAPAAEVDRLFKISLSKSNVIPSTYVDYGRFLYLQERYNDSIDILNTALDLDPKVKNARSHISFVHYLMKDYSNACKWALEAEKNQDELEDGYLKSMCKS